MATDQVPARYTFRDLAHADALLAVHGSKHFVGMTNAQYDEWAAERNELVAYRDSRLLHVVLLLCSKCDGTGRVQWRHRHDGVCYLCKGDGWSRRGRRARGE
jgi:hypothetical protein